MTHISVANLALFSELSNKMNLRLYEIPDKKYETPLRPRFSPKPIDYSIVLFFGKDSDNLVNKQKSGGIFMRNLLIVLTGS